MAESKDVNVPSNEDDEELTASSVQKGKTYPKGSDSKDESKTEETKKTTKRPPKNLVYDQFNPDDGHSHHNGGWAVFEYPSPQEMEPSVERVKHHVEDRVRRAGYAVDSEVVPYDKDDNNFRVAVRYA